MVEHARQNASQPGTPVPSAVGRELRDAREALGISVSEMASALRIRSVYIEALEDGRFSDLPGRPYALGFARSLASHLGLDPDSIALRLRDEVMGTATPVELIFPESTEDKRLSRAGWIAISLVLIAVAYGGWLTLSNRHRVNLPPEFTTLNAVPKAAPEVSVSEPVQSAPGEQAEDKTPQTPAEAAPPAPATASASSSDTAKPVATAQPTSPPSPATAAPVAPATAGAPPAPLAAKTADVKPATVATVNSAPVPTAPAPAKSVAVPPPAPSPAASSNESEDEEDVTPEPTAIAAVPAAPVTKPEASASPAPAATPAATTPPNRIVLRARQDSWVQIQSADGVTVMARTLKPGDTYDVPDRPGLRLTTGNAGALDVIVDGQTVPSLGQIGAVRRNVALDPSRLKSGTALE